jgi:hypothetical protein
MNPGLPGSGMSGVEFEEPFQRRTSVLAIFALVLGLICFLPGPGVLAIILGGAALVFIGQSRGRLGGTGLAATGIVLGLLCSVLWIAIGIGVRQSQQVFNTSFLQPVGTTISGVMSKDRTAARAHLSKTTDAKVTDEMLDGFAVKIDGALGAYKGPPSGLIEFFGLYSAAGPAMQAMQGLGRQDLIPVAARFDKGVAIVGVAMDPSGGPGPAGGIPPIVMSNVVVIPASSPNSPIWLLDPALTPAAPGVQFQFPTPGAPPPPVPVPETPETPAGGAPEGEPAESPAPPK